MEDEIVPADKRQRKLVLAATALLGVAAVATLVVVDRQLDQIVQLAEEDLPSAAERMVRLTTVVAWVGGLGFVGMGAWFWRLGRRINRANRFPPPGMKVLKDTTVRTGRKARTTANLAQVSALVCVVVGTVGMWYLYRVAVAVLRL